MKFPFWCCVAVVLGVLCPQGSAQEIKVDSALLTLIEHAEISAIDDNEAVLVFERARTELTIAQMVANNDVKVRFARKSQEVALAELKRSLESVEKFPKSVSQTELDRLQLLADKSALEIEQATLDHEQAVQTRNLKQTDVDRARLALERRTIKAPFPGMIVQWKKQRGEWLEPGTPVVRLIRLNRLRAEAFLSSKSLPINLIGRSVTLVIDLPGKPKSRFPGKVTFVDPEIDPVNEQVRIWAEIDNSDLLLRPGQSASLIIGTSKD
jgi:macrolide-specific efflux system membrane fusion protein